MNRRLKVLYVDDEPDLHMITQMALEVGPFDVATCESGEKGLELARSMHPDLVLLDVMMPGMDGTATLNELQTTMETRNIPVIFLTAKSQPGEVAHLKDLGAIEVIIKPFDPMTLARDVEDILKAHHLLS